MGILSQSGREMIHRTSLEILGSIGVKIDHLEILKRLYKAGARPGKSGNSVRFSPKMVEEYLQLLPSTVRFSDLEGNVTKVRSGGKTLFWTGNALYLVKGQRRKAIKSTDFISFVRIVDSLESVHATVGTSIADYPPFARDMVGFRLMVENSSKHTRPCIYTPLGVEAILEMSQVILGNKQLRDYPIFSLGYTIVSPLHWTETALEIFLKSSGYGIPIMVNAEPMAGGTSPVTLAGSVSLANAETLSGIIINQILEEGRPCIYNIGFAHTLDMRTGAALTGAPENGLLGAAGAEMAEFYNLPSVSWMSTESMVPDAQCSYEKMTTGLLHALSRTNIIWGVGNLESTLSLSFEQAIIDNEIAKIILRAQEGITVSKETLALDIIRKVGFKGDFLSTNHTLSHFRRELALLRLGNRSQREIWSEQGCKSIQQKAKERVRAILLGEKRSYLTEEQKKELKKIEERWIRRAKRGSAVEKK